MIPASYRKFIVAALTAVGIILTILLSHGVTQQWVSIALTIVNALGVYLVPNTPPAVTKTAASPVVVNPPTNGTGGAA